MSNLCRAIRPLGRGCWLFLAVCFLVPAANAAPASTVDLAKVIEAIKREIAAADDGSIDEAQILLDVVSAGKDGFGVSTVDLSAAKDEASKAPLKRRITIDLTPPKAPRTTARPPAGPLAMAIAELRGAVRKAVAAEPTFDVKRLVIDFEFVIERDAKGGIAFVVHPLDRRFESSSIQQLKVKFGSKDR
jgi:hypothetical protein